MPRYRPTRRQDLLRFLCLLTIVYAVDYHDTRLYGLGDPDPTTLIALVTLVNQINAIPRLPISRPNDLSDKILEEYSPEYFNNTWGLYPPRFNTLVNLIKDHVVFQASPTGRHQASVRDQLKVALLRIVKGHSTHSVMFQMGVPKGSVSSYTLRCVKAIASLECKFIVWPDEAERLALSKAFEANGFPGCVGAIDGISLPFRTSPSFQTKEWKTCKCEYAMGATVVCDDQKRIRGFKTGYPTSYSASTAYEIIGLPLYPDVFFDDGQYLLADCGYPLRPRIITSFRDCELVDPRNRAFTDMHAKARVVVKNTCLDLKNKVQSLKRIPLAVESEGDIAKVVKWCVAGAVLYNFTLLCDQATGELQGLSNNILAESRPRLEEHKRRLSTTPNFLAPEDTRALGIQRRGQLMTLLK